MTRQGIREYTLAVHDRYKNGSKEEKGEILDEFTKVTGLHRKTVIRLLKCVRRIPSIKRRGRPSIYGPEVSSMLIKIWDASDRLCSKRLQPFMSEMVKILRRYGQERIDATLEIQLCKISSSTIDRMLRQTRSRGKKSISTTRPGGILKSYIPVRTFADWNENRPGFMEIDLVAHCGESLDGSCLNTLCAVDIATGWTECLPILGKYQERVKQAVHHMSQRLPFPLLGIDSDNGGEFINQYFYKYCLDHKIIFTRSRSYKKNDNCYVEQKNGNVVRRLVGYGRYNSQAAWECLNRVYDLVRLYINFFQPTMKLISKTRHGSKVCKVYDTALTPYQRLLKLNDLPATKKIELEKLYAQLNPISLRGHINENLEALWKLAERHNGNRINDSIKPSSVTV